MLKENLSRITWFEDIYGPNFRPNYFQLKTLQVVLDIFALENPRGDIFDLNTALEYTKHLLPYIDEFTRTKSIEEYLKTKTIALEMLWQQYHGNKEYNFLDVANAYTFILEATGLISGSESATAKYRNDIGTINWMKLPLKMSKRYKKPKDKIYCIDELVALVQEIRRSEEVQVGLTTGKFRERLSPEHVRLFDSTPYPLGLEGLSVVFIESKKSILYRANLQGKNPMVLEDDERLKMVASHAAIDYVGLLDPVDENLQSLNTLDGYFTSKQAALNPNLWFIGASNHYARELFEERITNNKMSTILLYLDQTETQSTSFLNQQIRDNQLS